MWSRFVSFVPKPQDPKSPFEKKLFSRFLKFDALDNKRARYVPSQSLSVMFPRKSPFQKPKPQKEHPMALRQLLLVKILWDHIQRYMSTHHWYAIKKAIEQTHSTLQYKVSTIHRKAIDYFLRFNRDFYDLTDEWHRLRRSFEPLARYHWVDAQNAADFQTIVEGYNIKSLLIQGLAEKSKAILDSYKLESLKFSNSKHMDLGNKLRMLSTLKRPFSKH